MVSIPWMPDCVAIFINMGHWIEKKINTHLFRYKKF